MKAACVLPLLALSIQAAPAQLRCLESEAAIEIRNGDSLVLRYHKRPTAEAAKHNPLYARTGYIHPLCTPSGRVVTGDYEPDHPHQHGLFFAWTKTRFAGRAPEFWNQLQGSGRVSHLKTLAIHSRPEESGFEVMHRYEDLGAPGGPVAVLDETWSLRARVDPRGRYLLDLHVVQRCAGETPLTVETYHYGGMAIRGPSAWLGEEEDRLLTSEGRGRIAGNHTRPAWVKLSGAIDGAPCGIVALQHPGHFRYPQWVRLHPSKPYFVFAPMVEEPFAITPREPFESRYRFVVFDGEVADAEIATWQAW